MKTKEDDLLRSILGTDNENRNSPETTRSQAYRQADQQESALARPLHGQLEPPVALQKETPAHRIVLLLRARGMSVREIYSHLGGQFENGMPRSGTGMFSYQHLLTICRQPWFKKQLVSILEDAGIDAVTAALEVEVLPSIEELVRLRDTAASETVRLNACNSIIDRIRGKATQHIVSQVTHGYERVPSEAEELDRELEKVEQIIRGGAN